MTAFHFKSLYECSWGCGFLASTPPLVERCNACGVTSKTLGEFCKCGAQNFSFVCPACGGDVVVDHPDTIGPRQPFAEEVDGGAHV